MDDTITGESDGASDGEDGAGEGDAMADDGDEPAANGPAAFKMTKVGSSPPPNQWQSRGVWQLSDATMTLSQAHLAAQDKKLKGRLVMRQQLMTEEEAQLNPQVNQSRRKAAKQARKEAAKHDKKALVMATLAHGMYIAVFILSHPPRASYPIPFTRACTNHAVSHAQGPAARTHTASRQTMWGRWSKHYWAVSIPISATHWLLNIANSRYKL
jgi:hypothetical protein